MSLTCVDHYLLAAARALRWSGCLTILCIATNPVSAADCPADHAKLTAALRASVKPSGGPPNGGFENHEWAAVVTRDGVVCAVAFSGAVATDQWPGSRAIAVEKATTANAFSLKGMALSTANLFALAQTAEQASDTKTAVAAYKRFLKLTPEDPTAPAIRQRIKQLKQQAQLPTVSSG